VTDSIVVLGIPLSTVSAEEAVARGLAGGLVLAPSGPGLCDVGQDPDYRDALLESDLNLTDSSFVLLARLLRGHRLVARTSGFRYLDRLLRESSVQSAGSSFWVMPSATASERNRGWLNTHGHDVAAGDCYLAPIYERGGKVEDPELLETLEQRRPAHIFVCIGSGVQEKLGLYLKQNLTYTPGIHCIGAAIAFLSGEQARIPVWADRSGLGWLVRCVRDPRVFVPRYLRAFKLGYLVLRYDEKAPPTVGASR
jgi:N-acetylglucosaminyldiphosphoundecaprenol N-acetyl-beta-D-mannosaminyltransferase